MDVRKTNLSKRSGRESSAAENDTSPKPALDVSALANALALVGTFSNELFHLTTSEQIFNHVVLTVKRLLGVDTVEVFSRAADFESDSARAVFKSGQARVTTHPEGNSECIVAIRGVSGTLAVMRVADRTDWAPFTAADVAVLEAIGAQVGLRLENIRLTLELARQQASSIQALAAAIEVKDRYTSGHTKRVGAYADAIVVHLPIIAIEKEKIRLAGVLHDIGKIGVPDRILLKPSRLTEEEWNEMRLHTEAGFDIVSQVAGLEEIAEILRHHHERWDGSGYPRGLKGDSIPFASRVIAVADTFDAIVTDRPYRAAMPPSEARDIIVELAGTHFDPVVVAAFESAFSDLEASALGRPIN
jgi:HD-GYP domain-containing protein (c-di-GMP phosphodiesterase class II)